jgi:hypothetical protein
MAEKEDVAPAPVLVPCPINKVNKPNSLVVNECFSCHCNTPLAVPEIIFILTLIA